jgi:hypothetical protein
MSAYMVRLGGEWVETPLVGKTRLSGVDIPFGGGGEEPTYEALTFPEPPNLTDAHDGTDSYNMGVRFHVEEDAPCVGVYWRVPDSVATPPPPGDGVHVAALWTVTGETRVALKEFLPDPGENQDILFDAPYGLTADVQYVASIFTVHYTHRSGSFPISTPSGNGIGAVGKLTLTSFAGTFPASDNGAFFYISPLIGL